MRKYYITILFVALILSTYIITSHQCVNAQNIEQRLAGRILIQVNESGEAWYVNPENLRRYYMGRPLDAFNLMREFSLGVSNKDFDAYGIKTPARLSGKILLKPEDNGRAYYVNPIDLKMHYLGRPADAFRIMREFGLGITNEDLNNIPLYNPTEEIKEDSIPVSVLHNVPFTSQAPLANWSNQVYQDGCEEASAIMAMLWVNKETITKGEAEKKILAISNFEEENYGEYRDISIADTKRMINDYFNYNNVRLKENVTSEDLITELKNGNVIIAPMNGQKLGNPNFTAPGPINHMLVIIGWDEESLQFITNDPGTRNGEKYRYSKLTIINSIRDYPTGYHELNSGGGKNVLVVMPN